MRFNVPCLDCGQLSRNGSRCERCQGVVDARTNERKQQRQHYKGDYSKRAKAVRESATICWICNEPARLGDPWTADHVYPGIPDSPLLAAHRSCNSRRGNKPIDPHQ